jgi:hypothetical protein
MRSKRRSISSRGFYSRTSLHPSLHAKKYDEGKDRWQARVTKDWPVYFLIQDDTYILQDITRHPK